MKEFKEYRKVLVAATRGNSTAYVVNRLMQEGFEVKLVVEKKISAQTVLKIRLKRLGFFSTFFQLVFQVVIVPFLRREAAKRITELEKEHGLIAEFPEIDTDWVSSVNQSGFLESVKQFNPEIIVLNGTRIVSSKTLAAVGVPVVNLHVGITPYFRGIHGAYWANYKQLPNLCGITLHYVDSGVDTGNVIGQRVVKPQKQDNFVSYPVLQYSEGLNLLVAFLMGRSSQLSVVNTSLTVPSRQWYHPTVFQYLYGRLFKGVK